MIVEVKMKGLGMMEVWLGRAEKEQLAVNCSERESMKRLNDCVN